MVTRIFQWVAAALVALAVNAGTARGQEVAAPALVHDVAEGTLTLTFDVQAGAWMAAARGNERVVLTPVVEGEGGVISFPPVVVEGRRARISRERKARSGEVDAKGELYVTPGRAARYEATVDAKAWSQVDGATLSTKVVMERCGCEVPERPMVGMARALPTGVALAVETRGVTKESPAVVATAEPVEEPRVASEMIETFGMTGSVTGGAVAAGGALERVAAPFPFVSAGTEEAWMVLGGASEGTVARFIDRHRDGATLVVYFAVGSAKLEMDRSDNRRVLEELLESLRALKGAARLGVVVGAFTSPEGGTQLNRWLADERARTVKEFVVERSALTVDDVVAYGVGPDWGGLRAMVAASSMPGREDVLRVIDEYPIWNVRTQVGRLTTLMKLRDGECYRYIAKYFFPRLRNAAFIKVFYGGE
jgi:outer membrane protein OmpA-like peptidoglycan-associated protein